MKFLAKYLIFVAIGVTTGIGQFGIESWQWWVTSLALTVLVWFHDWAEEN